MLTKKYKILILLIIVFTLTSAYQANFFKKSNHSVFKFNTGMNQEKQDFIHAEGRTLVQNGRSIILKSICFSNDYENQKDSLNLLKTHHHREQDFEYVAKTLKKNCIRFAFNANWFDDEDVTKNKHNIWTWFDQNIAWAKKYGIYLVLDMHISVGATWLDTTAMKGTSPNDPKWLWNDKKKIQKHLNIWDAIAKRYQHETIIAAYEILNEPLTADHFGKQWIGSPRSLAEKTVAKIRNTDSNHLIMIDTLAGVNMSYDIGTVKQQNLLSINDGNIIYDFHFYEPSLYTHKGASWATVGDATEKYPDESLIILIGELDYKNDYKDNISTSDSIAVQNKWQYISSDFIKPDETAVCGQPYFIMEQKMLKSDIVYFDNYVIEEKSPSGKIKIIKKVYISKRTIDTYYHISNKTVSEDSFLRIKNIPNSGVDDEYCLAIKGVTKKALPGWDSELNWFFIKPNHQYRISGYVKGNRVGLKPQLRIIFWSDRNKVVFKRNKEYIREMINQWIKFSSTNSVPISLFEFGLMKTCYENDSGGQFWLGDVLDICKQNSIHWSYWNYHSFWMGVFINNPEDYPSKDKINKNIVDVLKRY